MLPTLATTNIPVTIYSGAQEMQEMQEMQEIELVQSARTDPRAFGELYQRYLGRIYRYLRARTRCEEDAADLTQQVFLQALAAIPGYREQGLPFAAWLFRIARNIAIDARRHRKLTLDWDLLPEALHPRSEQEHDPATGVLQREAIEALRALLLGLDSDKRELIALRFVAGLTAREIAAIVGKNEAAVQKQIVRTLHALKEQYHGEQAE
jgi:RNA polymerase sigma-70 factor, ECF subfamily